jgi:hypothetical protein
MENQGPFRVKINTSMSPMAANRLDLTRGHPAAIRAQGLRAAADFPRKIARDSHGA